MIIKLEELYHKYIDIDPILAAYIITLASIFVFTCLFIL